MSGRSHPARSAPEGSELHGAPQAQRKRCWVDRLRARSKNAPQTKPLEWFASARDELPSGARATLDGSIVQP